MHSAVAPGARLAVVHPVTFPNFESDNAIVESVAVPVLVITKLYVIVNIFAVFTNDKVRVAVIVVVVPSEEQTSLPAPAGGSPHAVAVLDTVPASIFACVKV